MLQAANYTYQWTKTVPPPFTASLMKRTALGRCFPMFSHGTSITLITLYVISYKVKWKNTGCERQTYLTEKLLILKNSQNSFSADESTNYSLTILTDGKQGFSPAKTCKMCVTPYNLTNQWISNQQLCTALFISSVAHVPAKTYVLLEEE